MRKITSISIDEELKIEIDKRHLRLSSLISELIRNYIHENDELDLSLKSGKKSTISLKEETISLLKYLKKEEGYDIFLLRLILPIYFHRSDLIQTEDENFLYLKMEAEDILEKIGIEFVKDSDHIVFPKFNH